MSAKQLNPAYDGMTDQQVKRFKYWEFRTMAMCIFGYALFYFIYNIADGAMIGSEDLSVSGIDADSKDGAFNDAMKDLRKGMVGFVDKHFKFETYILELGEADKKGRVKELYISGGTEMGVAKKTRFKVFLERKIGPKVTKSEIGTIVAVEVMDGVTKCQVASGEDAIKEKFNNGDKLVVILDKQGTAAGGFFKGLVGA